MTPLAEVAWVLRGYVLDRATSASALPVLSFDRRFSASEGVERLQPGCRSCEGKPDP